MMKLRIKSSRRDFSHISASGRSSKAPGVSVSMPCAFHSTKNFSGVPVVREAMEGAIELNVPLVVDVGFGPSWAEAK